MKNLILKVAIVSSAISLANITIAACGDGFIDLDSSGLPLTYDTDNNPSTPDMSEACDLGLNNDAVTLSVLAGTDCSGQSNPLSGCTSDCQVKPAECGDWTCSDVTDLNKQYEDLTSIDTTSPANFGGLTSNLVSQGGMLELYEWLKCANSTDNNGIIFFNNNSMYNQDCRFYDRGNTPTGTEIAAPANDLGSICSSNPTATGCDNYWMALSRFQTMNINTPVNSVKLNTGVLYNDTECDGTKSFYGDTTGNPVFPSNPVNINCNPL